MLDFKNLGSFVVLAEELNYTRAADRLGITQSALTYRIQRLEQDVGAVLIERGSRRSWELTPAGALFFGRMQSGLQQLETALREVQRLGSGEVGELLVGIMPSISPVLVCYAISALRSKLPEIRTSIRELAADEQLDALRRGHLDAALVRGSEPVGNMWVHRLLSEPLVAVLPADRTWGESGDLIALRELAGETFTVVGRGEESPARKELVALCADHGFRPRIGAEAPLAVALGLVQAGHGIAVLPESTSRTSAANVAKVALEDLSTEIYLATNPGRQSLALGTFCKALREGGRARHQEHAPPAAA